MKVCTESLRRFKTMVPLGLLRGEVEGCQVGGLWLRHPISLRAIISLTRFPIPSFHGILHSEKKVLQLIRSVKVILLIKEDKVFNKRCIWIYRFL